jgi:hypothetical protein
MRRAGKLVIIASLSGSPIAAAQIPAPARLTVTLSGAYNASIETREGPRNDRTYAAISLRATWPLQKRRIAMEYVADLGSLALATANRTYRFEASECEGTCPLYLRRVSDRYATVGVGVSPIGLQVRLPLLSRVTLTSGASAGGLYFLRPVPDYKAARLNFVAEAGGTLDVTLGSRRVLSMGYRFQHISNAGIAPVNVGLNSHLLVIGWALRRQEAGAR